MALLSCLCSYRHLFAGLTNKSLRELGRRAHPGLQRPPDDLRLAPPPAQRPHPPRPRQPTYELTDHGRRIAVFFTKTYTRILNPSLAELDPALPDEIAQRSPLARAWRAFEHALDARIADAHLTA